MNFSKIINRIREAFMVSGYSSTAKTLGMLSDQQLTDIGVSRELLKLGAKGYPWREQEMVKVMPNNLTKLKTAKVAANTPIMPSRPKAA